MKIKGIIAEDFLNYKDPSLFIISSVCNWKCCKEQNLDISICQNNNLTTQPTIEISPEYIYNTFVNNDITKAIVFGGLEPIDQLSEVIEIIDYFRSNNNNTDIIIYTGYYPEEISKQLTQLKHYNNILVKFGRYIPNRPPKYDETLGVWLVSDNQWCEKIS